MMFVLSSSDQGKSTIHLISDNTLKKKNGLIAISGLLLLLLFIAILKSVMYSIALDFVY